MVLLVKTSMFHQESIRFFKILYDLVIRLYEVLFNFSRYYFIRFLNFLKICWSFLETSFIIESLNGSSAINQKLKENYLSSLSDSYNTGS